jgi:hypothetical protein
METVEQLDIDPLLSRYRMWGKGELPYPPKVMLRLLIYAYCTGMLVAPHVVAAGTGPTSPAHVYTIAIANQATLAGITLYNRRSR